MEEERGSAQQNPTGEASSAPAIAVSWTPFVFAASLLFLAVALMAFVAYKVTRLPSIESRQGLVIKSAKWYCTLNRKASQDVTTAIQGMVQSDSLIVHAHDNVLGDVCKKHGGSGDPKTLEVDLVYRIHATATHDGWLTILGPVRGASHFGPTPPPELPGLGAAEHEDRQKTELFGRQAAEYEKQIDQLTEALAAAVIPVRWPYLTLQRVWYAPSQPESRDGYRNKVYFILTNGGKEAEIWTPLWESVEVVEQSPLAALLFREGSKGYMADDWEAPDQGSGCLKIRPGQSVKGWIGLLPPHGEGLEVRINKGKTGALLFPLKVEGKLTFERILI